MPRAAMAQALTNRPLETAGALNRAMKAVTNDPAQYPENQPNQQPTQKPSEEQK